uniref:Uncharacterized protein n=1 Tax=Pseudomonas putida TaxID=303 RepID=A0A336TQM6_PSEPU|nr:Hypothetical protein [Pseudomonas putida]
MCGGGPHTFEGAPNISPGPAHICGAAPHIAPHPRRRSRLPGMPIGYQSSVLTDSGVIALPGIGQHPQEVLAQPVRAEDGSI